MLTDIRKTYKLDAVEVPVLRGIDVLIRPGLFTVVLGPSGSGKTSLLNLIGGIDRPDTGEVVVAGRRLNDLPDHELADFRSEHIGFVFQNFNLLPVLTAYENIEYPLVIAGLPPAKRHNRVVKLLHAVGLEDRAKNKPGELSGGQRQRVAIARALARKPKLVIADEPTANLDSHTGAAILSLMRRMQVRYGISFIFSSHDRDLIGAADDLLFLHDGMIKKVRRKPDVLPPKVVVALGALPDGSGAAAADDGPASATQVEPTAMPSEVQAMASWLSAVQGDGVNVDVAEDGVVRASPDLLEADEAAAPQPTEVPAAAPVLLPSEPTEPTNPTEVAEPTAVAEPAEGHVPLAQTDLVLVEPVPPGGPMVPAAPVAPAVVLPDGVHVEEMDPLDGMGQAYFPALSEPQAREATPARTAAPGEHPA